jgi:hypothetical protein
MLNVAMATDCVMGIINKEHLRGKNDERKN